MSRRQHQAKSRKQQSVANSNSIIPVVRHAAAPAPTPEPHIVPVVVPVVTPVAAPTTKLQAAPNVIPAVQYQPAHVTEKAPASQRRPKANTRRRNMVVEPVVASVLVAAPHVPVQTIEQIEQPSVPVVTPAMQTPAPKREHHAQAPRAARGRVKEPLRWSFGYADVAAAANVSVDRVRHASARIGGREPSLVMTDLRSVARFIEGRRLRTAA